MLFVTSRAYRDARSAFLVGWLVGFLFHLGTLWWIARLYATEIVYPVIRIPALVSVAAYQGLFYGVAFLGWNLVSATYWWLWPAIWVVTEFSRSLTILAFPWTILPNSLSAQPILLQPAAVGGVWLLGMGIAWINLLLVKAAEGRRLSMVFAASVILVAWIFWGAVVSDRETGTVQVAIVQPNALPEFKWRPGGRGRVFRDLKKLSRAAAESLGSADGLIVWPETALPVIIRSGGGSERWLSGLADELKFPVITGALGTKRERGEPLPTNSAYLVLPHQGFVSRYDKMHLVPFSEKMPLSDRIPILKKINLGQGDYAKGSEVVLLPVHGAKTSVLICFEAILPRLVRKHVRAGSELLINITNDSWFGNTGAPEQHAAMAVIRAVEQRRWLVRAANSGVSLIADPWGRVEQRSMLFKPEVLVGAVRPRQALSFYARAGDWVVLVAVAMCALLPFVLKGKRECLGRSS